jgi:multiple sugar transport system permease protein
MIFQGLLNYVSILHDTLFITSLKNTIYIVLGLSIAMWIALGLALALKNIKKAFIRNIFRTIFFIPTVVMSVAAAQIWTWMYQPSYGVINYLLSSIGFKPFLWLTSPQQVIPALIIVILWKNLGFTIILFEAGLSSIPGIFYEASEIDGATKWQQFKYITWPLLTPTLLFVFVTGFISALQTFTQPYVMTMGGPGTSSYTLVFYVYQRAFAYKDLGYASALSYIIFLIIFIASYLQLRYVKERVWA